MDINELRENMNQKSDDELLGMLSRRNLYSPVQIDIAIEILKNRKESPAVLVKENDSDLTETADDPTSLFKPEDVRKIVEEAEEPVPEKKENTEELPKISSDYINYQKTAKEAESAKKKSKAPLVITLIIAVLIIVSVALMFIFRPGVGFFISNYEHGNYETAQFFYRWCKGNKNALEEMNEYFKENAIIITDDYLDGKLSYEDAREQLSSIKMFDVELAEEYLEELKNADKAETLYEEGAALYDSGKYYEAIKTLSSIYKGYKKYDMVEEAIEDSRKLLKSDLEKKMQEWLETHDFESALGYIESIKDVFSNDPDIQSYENAVAEQIEANEVRNAAADDFYENGGDADSSFRDESGLTYPSKKILTWEETGNKTVVEFGTVGSKSQFAFAVFADLGNGIEEIYSYKDALYDIYQGSISVSNGKIVITGKINTNGVLEDGEDEYTDVSYTLKFNGEEAYLG